MIIGVFQFFVGVSPVMFGMFLSTFILSDWKSEFKWLTFSVQDLARLNRKDDILAKDLVASKIYWGLWYFMITIVVLKGLISFMTSEVGKYNKHSKNCLVISYNVVISIIIDLD